MSVIKFITDSVEALEAIADSAATSVWIHGSETFVTFEEKIEEIIKVKGKNKEAVFVNIDAALIDTTPVVAQEEAPVEEAPAA